MKFQIHAGEGQIDPVAIQRALQAIDADVQLRIDPFAGRMRVSGRLDENAAIAALRGVGYRIEPIPASECCGGGCG